MATTIGANFNRTTCKMMCVTASSAVLVIAWTVASMYFSGLSAYWLVVTLPACRFQDYLTTVIYPTSAALAMVLLLSPAFAVVGDVKFGNLRLLLSSVIPLNLLGLVSAVVLTVTFAAIGAFFISYCLLVGYLFLLLAGGIFQANAVQVGRDALDDFNSPERSAFVHWYYWATYVPTFAAALTLGAEYWVSSPVAYTLLSVAFLLGMIVFSSLLLILCGVCYWLSRGQQTPSVVAVNPVTQIWKVTRLALQTAPAGGSGFLGRLNQTRRSLGGPADEDEVDNVTSFWLLIALMASLYGFFLWDDMWAMPFANAVVTRNMDSPAWALSSQATTSVIVFVGVPVYQMAIRPLLGKHSPPLLWRILAGLILQTISLGAVVWSSIETAAQFGSEVLSNVCNFNYDDDLFSDGGYAGRGIEWYILAVPQVINGFSQLLVFPAVIELILNDAPRVMQGLLIGIWYAMLSTHVLIGVAETMACAVYHWQYYILKTVLVLLSSVAFVTTSFFYKHNQVLHNNHCAAPSVVDIYH